MILDKLPDWLLAIMIDALMLIPFIDFIFTVPLQYYLWKRFDSQALMYMNMIYDVAGDFVIPGVGDIFPLNTLCVVASKVMKK